MCKPNTNSEYVCVCVCLCVLSDCVLLLAVYDRLEEAEASLRGDKAPGTRLCINEMGREGGREGEMKERWMRDGGRREMER